MQTRLTVRTRVVMFVTLSCLSVALSQQATKPLPVEKLLSTNSVIGGEIPQWAPNGSRILFVGGLGSRGLLTLPPQGGFPVRIPVELGAAGHFLATQMPIWSPDGRWIAYVSDKNGSSELWVWSVGDGSERQLTQLEGRINAFTWSPDSRWIAFSGDRYGNYDIWKVSLGNRGVQRLTHKDHYEVFPTWTPAGDQILYVELDEKWVEHDILVMTADGKNRRHLLRDTEFFDYRAGGTFGYPSVSPDGSQVLFRSHRSGWINHWVVPIEGGSPKPVAKEEADQSHARWSPDGSHILYVSNHNGTHELRVVPTKGGNPQILVRPQMGVVANAEWSPDGNQISYTLENPTQPKDLFVIELESRASRRLTTSLPAGHLEDSFVQPEKMTYTSSDGFDIAAYLYKPDLIAGQRFPAILWIHGGPTSQFNDTFQPHVQFFVQRGYVVLLPNIRGSSGYGKAFEEANNGCWGHCDLKDVLAGVKYLETLSFVNTDKTGITGTSYGGCMSMAAVAFAPGGFQAAIPGSGYGDWVHFLEEQELRHIKLLEYEFGSLEENKEVYRKNSPIHAVKNVTTPTFLIHGEGRFPGSDASRNFALELERYYKVSRYKAYPNENYYVRGKENRKEMLIDMLDFFDTFLKDRVADRTDDLSAADQQPLSTKTP